MSPKAALPAILTTLSIVISAPCLAAKGIRTDNPGDVCDLKFWGLYPNQLVTSTPPGIPNADPNSSIDGNADGTQNPATFFSAGAITDTTNPINIPAAYGATSTEAFFCTNSFAVLSDLWLADPQDPPNPASINPDLVATSGVMYYWPLPAEDLNTPNPLWEVMAWTLPASTFSGLASGGYEIEFDGWPCSFESSGSYPVGTPGAAIPVFSWGGNFYWYTNTCADVTNNPSGSPNNPSYENDLLLDYAGVVVGYVANPTPPSADFVPTPTPLTVPPGWTAAFVTTSQLAVSPSATTPGSSVTLTANVAGPSPNTPIVTGSVIFSDGANVLGAVNLNAQGIATLGVASFAAGTHSLTVSYDGYQPPTAPPATCVSPTPYTSCPTGPGVALFQASNSSAVQLTVGPAPTLTITAAPTTITLGQSSTIAWSTANTTSCTASGAWSGAKGGSGTLTATPVAAGSYSYALQCSGAGGTVSGSATLTVNPLPAPTVFITISPSTVTLGQSATVTWSSTNATTCVADSAWSGTKGTSGSLNVTPVAAGGFAYSLTCTGPGGSGNGAQALVVNATQPPPPNAPTVTISVAPTSIIAGQSATLTWSSTNATTCTADSAWTGSRATSGTLSVSPAGAGGYAYSLTCTGGGGTANGAAALVVNTAPTPPGPAPTVTLKISTSSITQGQSATLTWSSTNATSCVAGAAWSGAQATSGTQSVSPAAAGGYAYLLTCTGTGGTADSAVGLAVLSGSDSGNFNGGGKSGGGGGGSVDVWEVLGLLGLVGVASKRRMREREGCSRRDRCQA